ncbi:MAG TPA: AbrB/MazE/SpoVT family DNA-binding domain-containing protein [Acidisphaera sp.]|nr:AbrB/MazE/SpoVT family DNA-binding domain-containing protein [Acidisphaera sp.]
MGHHRIPVSSEGALVLPEELRQQLHLQCGGVLIAHNENGRLVLESAEDRVSRAQAIIRQYATNTVGVVDELIAERRAEAARE